MKHPNVVYVHDKICDLLRKQLEARGINNTFYYQYLYRIVQQIILSKQNLAISRSFKLCDIENGIEKLCDKLLQVASIPYILLNDCPKKHQLNSITFSPCIPRKVPSILKWKQVGQTSNDILIRDENLTKLNNVGNSVTNFIDSSVNLEIITSSNMKPQPSTMLSISEVNADNYKVCNDLPIDIMQLLDDSPNAIADNFHVICQPTIKEKEPLDFIKSGTNLTTSIWSDQFDFISLPTLTEHHCNTEIELVHNLNENAQRTWLLTKNEINNFRNDHRPKKEDNEFNINYSLNKLCKSFQKLNHNSDFSPFKEVFPNAKANKTVPTLCIEPENQTQNSLINTNTAGIEDLLDSNESHFKPIADKNEEFCTNKSSTTPVLVFDRSASGSLYLDKDYSKETKYFEYEIRGKVPSIPDPNIKFVLKFIVNKNDKACQTDTFVIIEPHNEQKLLNGTRSFIRKSLEVTNTSERKGINSTQNRRDLHENDEWLNNEYLRNIWKNTDSYYNSDVTLNERNQLREDVSHDGDQLLSHLSNLHLYMDEDGRSMEINRLVNDNYKYEITNINTTNSQRLFNDNVLFENNHFLQVSNIPPLWSVTL